MKRLAAEEAALTQALSSIDGNSASTRSAVPSGKRGGRSRAATKGARKSSPRKAAGGRHPASKSTAERLQGLQGLLAGGPKSRKDLASALNVSPVRVQQLLGELGSSVTSQPDPEQRRGRLWSLKGRTNGASAAKPAVKRSARASARARARKPSARKDAAAK